MTLRLTSLCNRESPHYLFVYASSHWDNIDVLRTTSYIFSRMLTILRQYPIKRALLISERDSSDEHNPTGFISSLCCSSKTTKVFFSYLDGFIFFSSDFRSHRRCRRRRRVIVIFSSYFTKNEVGSRRLCREVGAWESCTCESCYSIVFLNNIKAKSGEWRVKKAANKVVKKKKESSKIVFFSFFRVFLCWLFLFFTVLTKNSRFSRRTTTERVRD